MRILTTIFVLGFVILAFGWGTRRSPSIHVENRSGLGIEEVVLAVGRDRPVRASVDGSASRGQTLPLRAEGRARLEVRFADGTTADFDAGWFNPGARHDIHVVVVGRDSVRVESSGRGSRTRD